MHMKKISTVISFLISLTVCSQENFRYMPEHPQAGDTIRFTYTSAGDLANSLVPVEAVAYCYGTKDRKAEDITLKRKGYSYSGFVVTDPSQSLVNLAFYADKKFDNNYEE